MHVVPLLLYVQQLRSVVLEFKSTDRQVENQENQIPSLNSTIAGSLVVTIIDGVANCTVELVLTNRQSELLHTDSMDSL